MLNNLAKQILSGNLLERYTPFNLIFQLPPQKCPEDEAFLLETSTSLFNTVVGQGKCDFSAIRRLIIPADKINETNAHFVILNIVNVVLADFIKEFGDLSGKSITCKSWKEEGYLRLLPNGDYELRFWLCN